MPKPKKKTVKKATTKKPIASAAATGYEYAATVNRVVDGDTVHLTLYKEFALPVDFGFNIKDTLVLRKTADVDFRLYGINTPEIHGAEAATQKTAGMKSKTELERLLGLGTLRVISKTQDKYGRWLAIIYVKKADGTELCVNDEMIKGGFAKAYYGAGVKPV